MTRSSVRTLQAMMWVAVALAAGACRQTSRDLSLDEARAREACKTVLEAWQAGKQPADLKPDIIASDYVWLSGQKLVSFEVLPEEFNDGTNLHINVALTLQDADGKEKKSNALYIVGTSPVVTVFRD
jgi:hypothetical protein